MTTREQAPATVQTTAPTASRRSKITPERAQEYYDAVLDQLRKCGYEALTMEAVAAQACCSKSTLYRQWKSKPQLVAAALRAGRCVKFFSADTGTLAGDLVGAAQHAAAQAKRDTALIQALGHAVLQDSELKGALREALVEPEVASIDAMIERAVARGEIAADHPALPYVAAQLFGVMRSRPVLEGRDADADYLVGFVTKVLLPGLGLSLEDQAS
ncbi:TetR/AcrR family transcriptional regulator [Streptomyces sp. VRA16 Mangrove soil]|uniref:TetR/AcrR family transcriptional regulator n=1 Tax=Streptomyces sp. VRA16 Mangrove soil TaxID=2817434 RepID=UPI001A9DBF7E|nr:TetR/AcrR family transcriptional regulator [Streptomyces sp. VRA16 Mangrove soil]MBO1330842.1 TetR/AcrR family transcriptional regulator [Streptomyces sp. VRA16 Mangrove soil]